MGIFGSPVHKKDGYKHDVKVKTLILDTLTSIFFQDPITTKGEINLFINNLKIYAMKAKFNFKKSAHLFDGGNQGNNTQTTQVQEETVKAARKAKIKKGLIWGGVGIGVVAVGTWVGKKVFGKNKKNEEVEAPADEAPAERNEKPTGKADGKKADK